MPKKGFAGKKAAPFAKGGGRVKGHPKTAKGLPRKGVNPFAKKKGNK